MPGVPGSGGPVPKRSDQRRRRNKEDEPEATLEAWPVDEIPEPQEHWHPQAKRVLESLRKSGQSVLYQASDWALAELLCEQIDRSLKPQPIGVHPETGEPVMAKTPIKGQELNAILKGLTSLLATEGDRRRAKVELQNPQPANAGDADVPNIADYRDRLSG